MSNARCSSSLSPRFSLRQVAGRMAVIGLLAAAVAFPVTAHADGRSERLIQRLDGGSSLAGRLQAALLLGELKDPAALPALGRSLEAQNAALRAASAVALGRIGAAEAADGLVTRLKDAEPTVRIEAARALGQLRVAGAISPLAANLNDSELGVRLAAARALASYGSAQVVAPLSRVLLQGESSPEVEQVAQKLIAGLRGRLTVAEMAQVLASAPEKNERARAAKVLEHLGDAAAVTPLIAALEDPEPFVRMMAAQALRSFGDARTATALEGLLAREQNERVVRVARAVLGALTARRS